MDAVRGLGAMDLRREYDAIGLVSDYIRKHLDVTDETPSFEIFVVWKAKVLQNHKFLISTSLPDGMYYEVTYNGNKEEYYLDAYKKFENVRITREALIEMLTN